MNRNKRRFLRTLAGVTAALPVGMAWASLAATPRQSAGPFYPDQMPLDDDNDLTRMPEHDGVADGEISDVAGRVLDLNGRPLAGLRVEIWQCDANGRYRHSRDVGGMDPDPAFQGFGQVTTDAQGRYRFRTIRPVAYPGRTPHIHVAAFAGREPVLVTQLYVAGDPRNDGDFLFRRIPVEQRDLVSAAFEAVDVPGLAYTAQWDIVIGRG